jgi:hypothetical protein
MICNFSKNLGTTSIFWVPEGLHGAVPQWQPTNFRHNGTRFSPSGFVHPWCKVKGLCNMLGAQISLPSTSHCAFKFKRKNLVHVSKVLSV